MVKQYNDKQPFTFFEVQKSRVVKWVSLRPFFHIYLSICCLQTKSSYVHQGRRRNPLRTRPITAMGTIVVPYKKISYNKNLLQGLFQNIIFFFCEFGGKTRFLDFNRNTCFAVLMGKIRFCGKFCFHGFNEKFGLWFWPKHSILVENSILRSCQKTWFKYFGGKTQFCVSFVKNSILRFWQENSILRFFGKKNSLRFYRKSRFEDEILILRMRKWWKIK